MAFTQEDSMGNSSFPGLISILSLCLDKWVAHKDLLLNRRLRTTPVQNVSGFADLAHSTTNPEAKPQKGTGLCTPNSPDLSDCTPIQVYKTFLTLKLVLLTESLEQADSE